jgi:hypothetical protein
MFNGCKVYIPIHYELLDISGKRLTVKKDMDSYEELINKGFTSYIEFSRVGSNKYHQISINLFTLKRCNTLKMHSLDFEFGNEKKTIKVNKVVRLNQTDSMFYVEDNNEIYVKAYHVYISREYNKIKLYMQDIFNKKEENVGEKMELILRTNYIIDNGSILTQENKYLVFILAGGYFTSNLVYWLFDI